MLAIFVHALWISTLEISQTLLGIHPKPKTSFCDYLLDHNPNWVCVGAESSRDTN
jgi:hypothetical protein